MKPLRFSLRFSLRLSPSPAGIFIALDAAGRTLR